MTGVARFEQYAPPSITSARAFRAVDALSGRVAEADAEVERLREENAGLRCRVDELGAERDEADEVNASLRNRLAQVIGERDSWRARTGQ